MKHVVTLGDASLTTDDLALLVPPAWMNDQLISFWCEHLRINILENHPQVAIIPPNVTYLIALTNDGHDLEQITSAHCLQHKQLVLITVNNGHDTDFSNSATAVGSHWSLLIFHRPENTVYYLDSIPCAPNMCVSKSLASRIKRMVQAPSAKFATLSVPTQTNSYDCGAFVCVFAENAVGRFLNHEPIATMYKDGESLQSSVVDSKRQEIGKLACRLFDKHAKSTPSTG